LKKSWKNFFGGKPQYGGPPNTKRGKPENVVKPNPLQNPFKA